MSDEASILIRPFKASDRQEMLRLAPRLLIGVAPWRDADAVSTSVKQWVEESLASIDQPDHAVLVAEINGRVVGFVTLSSTRHFTGELDGYMGELVTVEDFQGRGVGRRLVAAAESWAEEHGLHRMTLDTGAHNAGARAFYERLGYDYEDVRLTKELP